MALYLGNTKISGVNVANTNLSGTDTSDATLNSGGQMLEGVTAYSKDVKYTGTIPTIAQAAPTAKKGSVQNYSIQVTPSVTNSAGYITGGTKTGNAVTVSASELVSGTKSITENGDYDVTIYKNVNVNVPVGADLPTFTITWDDDFNNILSITCDKSFYDVDESDSLVIETNGTDKIQSVCKMFMSGDSYNTFCYFGDNKPYIDFTYNNDGTITWNYPSIYALELNATANGTYTPPLASVYTGVTVNVPSSTPSLQSKTATPTESTQTITADSGYDGLSSVAVGAISSTYVGSGIARKNSTDLTASGATVSVPAGYYEEAASKSIASATHANPTVTVNSTTGLVTASHTQSAGYVSAGTTTDTLQLSTQAATTITPTESSQTAVAAGKYTTGAITVGAISKTYVGSGITQRDGDDLTASGATVTVPAGYYASQVTKSVASGTAGTPTAAKGTVSNHSITVTPSVTNTTGYIAGGTKSGTGVTVSASELVSGSQTITDNGTVDVTNLASVNVAIPFSTITVSSSDPSGGNDGDIWIKN